MTTWLLPARFAEDHIVHSPHASIEKARRLLGYEPRYSSLDAVTEAVEWLRAAHKLDLAAGV